MLSPLDTDHISLSMITNRGLKVWPNGFPETFCTDHWRCRFKPTEGFSMRKSDIIALLAKSEEHHIDTIKTENLYSFDGVEAYSLGQGQ
jgi:isocitrate dehydrogenase